MERPDNYFTEIYEQAIKAVTSREDAERYIDARGRRVLPWDYDSADYGQEAAAIAWAQHLVSERWPS